MIRNTFQLSSKTVLRSLTFSPRRAITTSASHMAAGDTGATRSGGVAQSDSINKREKANEDMYVRQQEREKLMQMKEKLLEQQKHLKDLDKQIADLGKDDK